MKMFRIILAFFVFWGLLWLEACRQEIPVNESTPIVTVQQTIVQDIPSTREIVPKPTEIPPVITPTTTETPKSTETPPPVIIPTTTEIPEPIETPTVDAPTMTGEAWTPEETPIQVEVDPKSAVIRFTCIEEGNSFEVELVFEEYELEQEIPKCYQYEIKLISTSGEMNIAYFQISEPDNSPMTTVSRNSPRVGVVSDNSHYLVKAVKGYLSPVQEYFSGSIIVIGCSGGQNFRKYVREEGPVEIDISCMPGFVRIDTSEGMVILTHPTYGEAKLTGSPNGEGHNQLFGFPETIDQYEMYYCTTWLRDECQP